MTDQAKVPDDLAQSGDQDAEPASAPTGAAAEEQETEDQDAGPASEPQQP